MPGLRVARKARHIVPAVHSPGWKSPAERPCGVNRLCCGFVSIHAPARGATPVPGAADANRSIRLTATQLIARKPRVVGAAAFPPWRHCASMRHGGPR